MNNKIYPNQELLNNIIFLEKLYLLDAEPSQARSSAEYQPEPLAENSGDDGSVAQVKVKSSNNYGLLYVFTCALLLLLPSNRHAASGKNVTQDSQDNIAQNREQIEVLASKLQELDTKTQILTAQVATDSIQSTDKVSQEVQAPEIQVTPVVPLENLNQLPEYEVPSIPLPILAPPPPSTLSPLSSVKVTTPFPDVVDNSLLPVPALPTFGSSFNLALDEGQTQLPPPPSAGLGVTALPDSPTLENIIPSSAPAPVAQAAQQWLGQTDTVYYSGSFQQKSSPEPQTEVAYEMPDLSYLSQEDLNQYVIVKPSAAPEASQQLPALESQGTTESNQLSLIAENTQSDGQQSELLTASDESLTSSVNPDIPANPVKSKPALFDDEDLSNYLDDAPLLDNAIIAQILGTSPTTEATEAQITNNSISTVDSSANDTIQSPESTQASDTEDTTESNSSVTAAADADEQPGLFADEDLKQFLASTPLFSKDIIQQKLK